MRTRPSPFLGSLLLALSLSLPGAAVHAGGAPQESAAAAPGLENSVVKVFSTLRRPDPYKPWTKAAPQDVTGSGVVIEGRRILTNAHVVGYASQVQVQANQAGDKVSASVVAISRGMDLAVLKLDDESFFNGRPALPRANVLPEVRDAVFAYGYPTGGTSLSITKGIVSRIEFVPIHYPVSGLRVQIDAAVNPGNSGGPVIAGDKMVGLAFAGASNAQNIGYIIPNEEIELFLRDVAAGRQDAKPAMFDTMQTLENPAMRRFLKLDKSVEGAVVVQHAGRGDAAYPLKEWDVVTRIGDYPVDNQGMVKLGANARVRFQYRVQQLAKNGFVPLTVVRNGKPLTVQLPVAPARPQLIPSLQGAYPSFFIYGPIVFSRATAEFMAGPASNPGTLQAMSFVANPLVTRRGDEPDAEHEELVVVSSPFFPHKLVAGYNNRSGSVLQSLNGVPVRSLGHLVALLRDSQDELLTLRFDQRGVETIVLPRQEVMAATEAILSDNGIRAQGSADMLEVWQQKKTAAQ
ncbi:S1C family serine protease [Janthinobacterium fluminis]|uniref:Trypsin-like peptidase domain-containing protein n=1 Tax=Janthinobacterium fluminis TaxID=2987524 RepID=A0ABT5K0U7_9BURK|nr:S1C family serine protease [Janthinobacterium fluminis]MDC8758604.1 trypsin-like peptidase domain-containing protein [Janthinobacterium fluminis]